MNIQDLNWLITDNYFDKFAYEPYQGFDLVESHIRAAHPEKYTPLVVEDQRFPKEFSWMRLHACASNYLYFWCMRPDPDRERLDQSVGAIIVKPLAAASDVIVDTLLLQFKLTVLVDRIIVCTTLFFLHNFITFKDDPCALTMKGAGFYTLEQLDYCFSSWSNLFVQPINLIANLFSPTFDVSASAGMLQYAYEIITPKKETEAILDQGRVKYLREHCGWKDVTDEMLISLGQVAHNRFNLSYFNAFGNKNKIYITASWRENHGHGIITDHWDSNY